MVCSAYSRVMPLCARSFVYSFANWVFRGEVVGSVRCIPVRSMASLAASFLIVWGLPRMVSWHTSRLLRISAALSMRGSLPSGSTMCCLLLRARSIRVCVKRRGVVVLVWGSDILLRISVLLMCLDQVPRAVAIFWGLAEVRLPFISEICFAAV